MDVDEGSSATSKQVSSKFSEVSAFFQAIKQDLSGNFSSFYCFL
jgi:hypothetical protein